MVKKRNSRKKRMIIVQNLEKKGKVNHGNERKNFFLGSFCNENNN